MNDLKKQMKESIEVRHYTFHFWKIFTVVIIYTLVFLIGAISINDFRLLSLSLLIIIPTSPFMIYYLYRIYLPITKANEYQYQEVLLNEIHTTFNQVGFNVSINVGAQTVKLYTKAIFNTHSLSSKNIEAYMNKKALIAYDIENEEVVVIKLVEEKKDVWESD